MMTDLAGAIKRHVRLKKKDPALYALAVEFETARFAKQQVSEIVSRIVKHKSRCGVSSPSERGNG